MRKAASRLGIEKLYPEQEQAIAESLAGRDVLMVLPTGFGKSACYQVPSMILEKPVVVISPLLALIRDQHQKLEHRGIPCIRIDGTVRGKARREALETLAGGGPLLILTTPESLENEQIREVLGKTGIGLAAIDEAHCISEWGHDFRPSYARIGIRLKELGSPPVLGLTATATSAVRKGIVRSLSMRDPHIVSASPHRSNLAFEAIPCEGHQRLRALVRLSRRLRRPGIIYCATRREVDAIYVLMRRFDVPTYRYHGGMTATERETEQKGFMRRRRRPVMIATSAFGLGIDKRDIRYILHYQASASLEQYVQEAGRAGRDGRRSNCLLLADQSDRTIHEALLARSRVRPDQLYRLGRALGAWDGEGRTPSLAALAVSAELGPRITSALLSRIEEAGHVRTEDGSVHILAEKGTIEERTRALAGQFETLRTQDSRRLDSLAEYVATEGCRAAFLRTYFGEDEGEPCGMCDNCLEKPERSAGFFAPIAKPEPEKPRGRRARRTRRDGAGQKKTATGRKKSRRRGGKSRRGGTAGRGRATAARASAPSGEAASVAGRTADAAAKAGPPGQSGQGQGENPGRKTGRRRRRRRRSRRRSGNRSGE